MQTRAQALEALRVADPMAKVDAVRRLRAAAASGQSSPDPDALLAEPAGLPGRPQRPPLVPPQQVAQRSPTTREGRAALLHALAHIEFNAINLALDAVWRFPSMPAAYYDDWLRVADEEATHFVLLRDHLATLDHGYGDFPAHDGLWALAARTAGDVLTRMALVPRTMEARGLDASPPIRAKLERVGDHAGAAILDLILRDEIGHVAIGNRWFGWLCAQRGIDPIAAHADLAGRHGAPRPKPPFNMDARRAAGFSQDELAKLAD